MRTARARYVIACTAMLAMIGAFGLTLVWMIPESTRGVGTFGTSVSPAWNVLSDKDISSSWGSSLSAVVPWLTPLWMAGVLLMYARAVAGCLSARRLRSRGVCCAPDYWQKELQRLSAKLRILRPILLLESLLADAPMVLGHFRPVILVPLGLIAGLSPGQMEAIFVHELAHIGRHDYLVNTAQRFVEALFFYHPAVWWISRRIRLEREYCCDDVVVSVRGNAHEYAVALTALEQNRLSDRQSAVAVTGGDLVKRIRRLLYPNTNGPWEPFVVVTILVASGVVSLAAWETKPYPHSSPVEPSESERALGPSYSPWLNQDVVYIINDAERAAFKRLTSNNERDKFIEQFWSRRDPSPGTLPNEFKEEHDRRLAYANQHFRTASGSVGWQTDRGHMYIVYGPLDEIESHPRGIEGSNPIEVWLYHHVDGIATTAQLPSSIPPGAAIFAWPRRYCCEAEMTVGRRSRRRDSESLRQPPGVPYPQGEGTNCRS